MKLLEQPIPASFLQLEAKIREISAGCKEAGRPPLLKEMDFRKETSEIIANPRELDQAVTFLHENGEYKKREGGRKRHEGSNRIKEAVVFARTCTYVCTYVHVRTCMYSAHQEQCTKHY